MKFTMKSPPMNRDNKLVKFWVKSWGLIARARYVRRVSKHWNRNFETKFWAKIRWIRWWKKNLQLDSNEERNWRLPRELAGWPINARSVALPSISQSGLGLSRAKRWRIKLIDELKKDYQRQATNWSKLKCQKLNRRKKRSDVQNLNA